MADEAHIEGSTAGTRTAIEVDCPSCGAKLAAGLSDDGSMQVGDESFTFRRTTDWVACESCGHMARMSDLLGDAPHPSGAPPVNPDAEALLDELRELAAD